MDNIQPQKENSEEMQLKEFLNRVEVKTMKKDLQKLREGQALKERDKIVKIKTPEEEKASKPIIVEPVKPAQSAVQKVAEKQTSEELVAMKQLKDYANEQEKQQIFYLETEKDNLEKQLQVIRKEQEPPLILEKNEILLERNDTETKLNSIVEEEKKIEDEQKAIVESEKMSNVPSDKQRLEKRRWTLEDGRENIEKKRWAIEQELQTAQGKIAQIDEQTDKLLITQKELREKIEDTNNSLKSVYSIIMQREEERIRLGKEKKSAEAITRAEEATKEKEKIMRQEWTQPKIEEKTFIKDLPEQKKNKLVERIEKTADKEEGERKKFLQSIEQWAQDDKDNKKP